MKWSTRAVSALLGHALLVVVGLYVHADQKVLLAAMEDVWRTSTRSRRERAGSPVRT